MKTISQDCSDAELSAAVAEPLVLKPWPRHPRYLVSNDGFLYTVGQRHKSGVWIKYEQPRKLSRSLHPTLGYLRGSVWAGKRQTHVWLHRAVLEAHVGPCPEGQQAAHLNGNKADCRLTNLQWVTPAENMAHQRLHGTALLGKKNHMATLSDMQALTAVMMRAVGIPTRQIATWFNVTTDCILAVHNLRNRKEIFTAQSVVALLRAHGITIADGKQEAGK
jgi:HNH endonuclease